MPEENINTEQDIEIIEKLAEARKQILEQLTCKKNYKVKPAKSNGLYLAKIKY